MNREDTIKARTRAVLDALASVELHPVNLDPYPGTVDEVADEIASFVLDLERAGIANGLAGMVRDRLERWEASRTRVELWNADPKCDHEIIYPAGGGIACRKCRGWYCL